MRFEKRIILLLQASILACSCLVAFAVPQASAAINKIPEPDPKPNSFGLEATKTQPAPTQGATISVPGSGASFSTSPVTVSGICPKGLLVQVYNNGVLAGSIDCANGSFSIQVTLYNGTNELTATVFDDLDQAGPESNKVSVSYNNASITAFGQLITLTSAFGRRAADPGTQLVWPLVLSGGTGPYAFSIDWGDGTSPELKSQALSGEVRISHTYKQAGVYHVIVKVTDANGVSAFLQLTAVANGKVTAAETTAANTKTVVVTKMLWIPVIVAAIMLVPAFWLGRRSELKSLHKRLQHDLDTYKDL